MRVLGVGARCVAPGGGVPSASRACSFHHGAVSGRQPGVSAIGRLPFPLSQRGVAGRSTAKRDVSPIASGGRRGLSPASTPAIPLNTTRQRGLGWGGAPG